MSENRAATALVVLVAAIVAVGAFSGGVAAQELSVSVDQADDGSATVTVTENDTAVENASVGVETVDENVTYDGEGNYTTDVNGTVGLPAPEQNVTINVTAEADNQTATTEADLTVAGNQTNETNETANATNESFGQAVSAYVFGLQNDSNKTGGLGPHLASWVVAHNPGNAPSHAGPPENMTRGPPENIGQGPPEHAGPPENRTAGGTGGGGPPGNAGSDGGPPENAGPGSDRGNGGAPPDQAGPK